MDGSVDRGLSLPGSYDPALVALSILIASLAAYSAFGLAERISASGKPAVRRLWLAAGAVAMGLGVWAMHFIAMLAFRLPVPVNYDVLTTLLSILPAIVAAGIVLLATTRARTGRPRLLLSGALMGIGIGTMHYTGMAAMRMAAVMLYDPVLFVLSLIVAFLLATAALYTKLLASGRNGHSRHYRTKLAAASIMGLAIAGMHYTGMAASYFFPTSDSQVTAAALDPMVLGVLVSLAAVLLLALVICVTGVDARLKGASAKIEHELKVAQSLLDEAKQRVDGPLLGESVAVRALREAVVNYAATNETLLLTGPPGAGQEAVARAIHHESRRASRAFIHVNCAMLQTSQLSTSSRALPSDPESSPPPIGEKFRLADGGTLYLENVDKLSLGMRDQLAEALQELEQQRKRGQPLKPDVRVIAYTSINLAEEGKGFRFSPALDQSLCKRQLSVPALAERREDIPVLVQYFIQHYARRLGKTVEVVSEASMERLQAYRWAGNIRELQNLIERVIVTAGGPVLEIDQSLLGGGISLDRYRLVRLLGRGGMGEVWLAKHQLLARPAAVKLICSDSLGGPERTQTLIKRFQREAQITANLNSPNTVKLYDFGVSETGSFYLVMELLSGIDLESMVNRFGPLSPARVVMLLRQACRSLSEAHEVGLVHRDIKPANLFICKMGREYDFLKVLDFGLVKDKNGDSASMLTATGNFIGTPAYMAPELIVGGEVDGRADLYAIGCVAYWMLTGRRVFESPNPVQTMMHHTKTPPPAPSDVCEMSIPGSLDQIVLACLQKAPDDRPRSGDELRQMLGQVELGEPWTEERAETWWQLHMPDLANWATGTPAARKMSECPL
ncbi:MAG: protein kinase [Acidobacteria bacterium]|nr:protein kinase [Acidobacteriota bacterium]